jgi:hypothetical protein
VDVHLLEVSPDFSRPESQVPVISGATPDVEV